MTSPATSQEEESASFLYALARRISTRVLVFVPLHRRARVLWFATPGGDDEITPLEAIGRSVLASGTGDTSDAGDPRAAVLLTHSLDGQLVGALVAQKEAGHVWSGAEHALLEFAAEFYRRPLARLARRPLPSPRLDLDAGRSRAEAAELASTMRAAADRGELFLLYQPEIDLTTGAVVAVEALTRWLHPIRGELGPDSFIALAEQSDLIHVLGAWVIEESFRDFSLWQARFDDLEITLRVNVSPAQLLRAGIVDAFAAALERHGIAGDRVCVELTENVAVADADALTRGLAGLKELGIRSALDDLASGYSTLSRLRALPVDLVKLDRSLVCGIDADQRAQVIVRGVVEMTRQLGAAVMAEGVETSEEADMLAQLGCRSAQGHYFARPMTAADAVTFLADWGSAPSPDHPAVT